MRCAKGIFAKGIFAKGFWGCTRFSLLRWEKGSETPSCGGEKGLRLPCSLGRSMRNEGASDPFPHRKRESQTLFPTAKGKPRKSPQPLSENPLSETHQHDRILCLFSLPRTLKAKFLSARPFKIKSSATSAKMCELTLP